MKQGLNIGCGPVYLQSDEYIAWENSDFADSESAHSWKIDKRRDFTTPFDDIGDNNVDYIVAWHIIEHVGLHQNASLVNEWFRMLKPGGKLFIACPNIKQIAVNIATATTPPWNDPYIQMVNIFGPYNGYDGDYHKWGYTPESLSELLLRCGFAQVRDLNPQQLSMEIGNNAKQIGFADYNLQMEATK